MKHTPTIRKISAIATAISIALPAPVAFAQTAPQSPDFMGLVRQPKVMPAEANGQPQPAAANPAQPRPAAVAAQAAGAGADAQKFPQAICMNNGFGREILAEVVAQKFDPKKPYENYMKDLEKKIFIERSAVHKSIYEYQNRPAGLSDLSVSRRARENVFTSLRATVVNICRRKFMGARQINSFNDKIESLTPNQCEAQQSVSEAYRVAREEYINFEAFIDNETKNYQNLFQTSSSDNTKDVDMFLDQLKQEKFNTAKQNFNADNNLAAKLAGEIKVIWSTAKKVVNGEEIPEGAYPNILNRIYDEKRLAQFNRAQTETTFSAVPRCDADGNLITAGAGRPGTGPAGLNQTQPPPGGGGAAAPGISGPQAGTKPPGEQLDDPSETQGNPPKDPRGNVQPVVQKKKTSTRIDEDDDFDYKPKKKVSTEGPGFFERNKGTIIVGGIGVAAVGGALWYKKDLDKKAKKTALEAEAEAQAALAAQQQNNSNSIVTVTDTSTNTSAENGQVGGTPATTSTPAGSILVVTGIPSGAQVGSELSNITVSIVDPRGIMTQDSDTNISLGCETPSPCTIQGTQIVNTDNGKAVFSDLRFTGAHKGVKLKVSAPGYQSVITSSPFDVTK